MPSSFVPRESLLGKYCISTTSCEQNSQSSVTFYSIFFCAVLSLKPYSMLNYYKEPSEVELHRWQLAVLENYHENNQLPIQFSVLFDFFLLNEKAHVKMSHPPTKTRVCM